ncbi:phosphotransferase [Mycoplasmatota bacterium]|nr:phosphotransferase [Mycoplasmatota bacterium]
MNKIETIIKKDYTLHPLRIEKVESGSGSTYLIKTFKNQYIGKLNNRKSIINIYEKVEPILNKQGINQCKVIRSNKNLLTVNDFVLYTYIPGYTYHQFNPIQEKNALLYMKKYHQILKTVPFVEDELPLENHWDKMRSIDYLINELTPITNDKDIHKGIDILSQYKYVLKNLPKQLIHSDLGPDNFIFNQDEVISIIDFTPDYNHELYSLGHFIYWNYLWDNHNIQKIDLLNYFHYYKEYSDLEDIFLIILLHVALIRILGVLMIDHKKKINKRLDILRQLLKIIVR